MSNYDDEKLRKIWNKGAEIPGKDPDRYREDKYGNPMFWDSYGKRTAMGWEVDHSKPKAKGGTDHLNNLQPMQHEANRKKSDDYPHNPNK